MVPRAGGVDAGRGMTAEDLEALTRRPGPGSHRTTLLVDGASIDTLEDLPPLRDRLLFVGLNPSPVSVEAGHYHQGRLGQSERTRPARASTRRCCEVFAKL